MRALNKVREALDLWEQGQEKMNQAARVLSSGPASFYFDNINIYVSALFDRFAPFKEGDRVEIIKAPNTNNGWHGCKHFLVRGAVGTVQAVDYYNDAFCADVVWDNETWIDQKGKEQPVTEKHAFRMWETQIQRLK